MRKGAIAVHRLSVRSGSLKQRQKAKKKQLLQKQNQMNSTTWNKKDEEQAPGGFIFDYIILRKCHIWPIAEFGPASRWRVGGCLLVARRWFKRCIVHVFIWYRIIQRWPSTLLLHHLTKTMQPVPSNSEVFCDTEKQAMCELMCFCSHGFNPYSDNGGSILAIAGKDFSIIAGDTRQSEGYNIQTRYARKVWQLWVVSVDIICWCPS